jgi:hypothetical protein
MTMSLLNVRPPYASHRIQTLSRFWILGGRRWAFTCRCGHSTNKYHRPTDALEMIEVHMLAAEASEREVRAAEKITGVRG